MTKLLLLSLAMLFNIYTSACSSVLPRFTVLTEHVESYKDGNRTIDIKSGTLFRFKCEGNARVSRIVERVSQFLIAPDNSNYNNLYISA